MPKNRVEVRTGGALVWPHVCVVCFGPATQELRTVFEGWDQVLLIPHCDSCHSKVKRLQDWKDGLFMIAVLFGALGAIMGVIGIGVREGWVELLHIGNTLMMAGASFLMFFGLSYALLWLLLFPLRLILHSKLAHPGVKRIKKKSDAVNSQLQFSMEGYADLFRQANGLA